jgi:site-specific DNA recombinase
VSASGDAGVVEMAVPQRCRVPVRARLKTRSPALTAQRIVSGPGLLTGICFCAGCGMAMRLRTEKGGRYRCYTCSTKSRQGETGCEGRTVPMDRLDMLVGNHIEHRLLQPKRPPRLSRSAAHRSIALLRTEIGGRKMVVIAGLSLVAAGIVTNASELALFFIAERLIA